MTNEASRRIVLNIFLTDILAKAEFESALRIFPELELTVTNIVGNKRQKLTGKVDYTVGFAKGKDIFDKIVPKESHLI
ncbi:hypothetical protein HDU91_006954, partial [Kappamyces sp. JEL0680]